MQMSVILCSHGLLDWFNKTILFYSIVFKKVIFTINLYKETTYLILVWCKIDRD
jgi:hypothetical protein